MDVILGEVEVQGLDVSDAVIAAASLTFPPKTVALRILDRDGREVFERQKAERSSHVFHASPSARSKAAISASSARSFCWASWRRCSALLSRLSST